MDLIYIADQTRRIAKNIIAFNGNKYLVADTLGIGDYDDEESEKKIQDVADDFLEIKNILNNAGFKFSKKSFSENGLQGYSYIWTDEAAGFDISVDFVMSNNYSIVKSVTIIDNCFSIVKKIKKYDDGDEYLDDILLDKYKRNMKNIKDNLINIIKQYINEVDDKTKLEKDKKDMEKSEDPLEER